MMQTTEYEIQKQCVYGPNSDIPVVVKGQACSGGGDAFAIAGVGTVPIPSPGLFLLTLAVIVASWIVVYWVARRREFEG